MAHSAMLTYRQAGRGGAEHQVTQYNLTSARQMGLLLTAHLTDELLLWCDVEAAVKRAALLTDGR